MNRVLLRRVAIAAACAAGAVAIVITGGLGLVLGTSGGAHWVLARVQGAIRDGSLTIRESRGTLASPLELRGVVWRTATLEVRVERLLLRWDLPGLFGRTLDLHRLHAEGVRVRSLAASAAEPAGATPDSLPSVRLPLTVRVRDLRVSDFLYSPAGDTAGLALDGLQAALDFEADQLRLSKLHAESRLFALDLRGRVEPHGDYPLDLDLGFRVRPPGRAELNGNAAVSGSLEAALVKLRLDAPCAATAEAQLSDVRQDLRFDGWLEFSRLDPHDLVASLPSMQTRGRIEARGTRARCAADVRVALRSDSLGAIDASGTLALAGDTLSVAPLLASVPGRPARVRVQGLVAGLGGEPRLELAADWRDLAWPLRGDTLGVSDAGRLRVEGTMARYALDLDAGVALAGGDLGRWQVEGTGDTSHLEIARLEGRPLDGVVRGRGEVAWKPRVRWEATLRGDSLDPGTRVADWPGRLGLEVATQGSVRDRVVEAAATLARLDGTLKDLPISGQGNFAMSGRSWSAREVRVAWGDARLALDGAAGESWDATASVSVPSVGMVVDGAAGALEAEGTLSGPRDRPKVRLAARGDSLSMRQYRAGALALSLDSGFGEDDSLTIDLEALRAWYGDRPIDRLAVQSSGSRRLHALSVSARGGGDTLALAAHGSLAPQRWQGTLERLELAHERSGAWRLDEPVAILASAQEVRVDSFSIRSGEGGVRGRADWSAGGALRASATLNAVPLGLFDRWLQEGASLRGTLDGTISARAERPEGPLFASARLTQSPAQVIYSITAVQRDTVHLGEGKLTFDSDADSAIGTMNIQWENGNRVDARVVLPGFNAMRPDSMNPVAGYIRARATDLAVLGAYMPGLDHTRGDLNADLVLMGTLFRPEMDGEIRLEDGTGAVPALGVVLQDFDLAVVCEPGRKISVNGSVRSGKGTLAITGDADLTERGKPVVRVGVKGTDLTVADIREAKVHASPDLELEFEGTRVDVTGQVEVPFARLVSIEKVEQMHAAPSPDVVFVGRKDSVSAGPGIHSRVRVVIGDDVEVRVPGFRGKPEGSILAIDAPGQPTRASGELKVTEGVYRAYGKDLRIDRGRLMFAGGPINNPGLDLRASTTASDGTVAGFQVTGTVESPVLAIFSNPAMSQSDALSYIMFGKSLEESGGGAGMAAQTAGQIGVQGTDMLARSIAGKFGIQDASVESKEGSLQEASLFLGTYLSPKLYVSYGIGLAESETTIRIRYRMSKHWSVQTESGTDPNGLLQYSSEK